MSGATLADLEGEDALRPTFGRRKATRANAAPRSVDSAVPDLRRRIGACASDMPTRAPWAFGGIVIVGLSIALWLNAFAAAGALARVASIF